MKNKYFEETLPEGYVTAFKVNATNKKTAVLLNIACLVVTAAVIALAYASIRPSDFSDNFRLSSYLLLAAAMLCYIVFHELVHGLAYKIMTKRKLKFGIALSAAFCGVPDIYVYRRTALISLLAPFTVFTVIFSLSAVLLHNEWDKLYAMILLGIHLGGCVGDLYDTFLYLFRFRDNSVLMRDTGPEQTFYTKK